MFLPFEDDRLSVILSKTLLLAADTKITNETRDRQAEDLDDVVDLTADPDLVFIKLVALVGG